MSRTVTCPACGRESTRVYRCSECGKDLVGDETTTDGGGRR
ncbi:transposase [Haloglomus irregulare]|nr:transposase [Haloglomus irregulare]